MSILPYLLPKAFLTWVEETYRAIVERQRDIANRQLDLAEIELEQRMQALGIEAPKAIAAPSAAQETEPADKPVKKAKKPKKSEGK